MNALKVIVTSLVIMLMAGCATCSPEKMAKARAYAKDGATGGKVGFYNETASASNYGGCYFGATGTSGSMFVEGREQPPPPAPPVVIQQPPMHYPQPMLLCDRGDIRCRQGRGRWRNDSYRWRW